MMFCQKCGAENADDATFCNKCGAAMGAGAVPTPAPVQEEPLTEKDKSTIVKCVAIIVAVAIIVIGGAGYYFLDTHGNYAYVAVHAHSTHLTEDVNVQILIDDEVVFSYSGLEPGEMAHADNYHVVYFSKFDNSKLITIKAISTGGFAGTLTDSKELIIQPNESYTIDLYI